MSRLLLNSVLLSGLLLSAGVAAQNNSVQAPISQAPVLPTPVSLAPIFVAYPKDGARVAADHVIFEGSVLPGASLSIDGRPVEVGLDGLFMEWLPLRPGINTLSLVSVQGGQSSGQSKSSLRFSVTSSPPAASLASRPARVVPGSLMPDGPWIRYGASALSLQDRRLDFSFQGSPGGRAVFWVGSRGPFSMTETAGGRYSGGYTLGTERVSSAAVRFLLIAPDGSRVQTTAPGTLSSLPGPRFGQVSAEDIGRGVNAYLAGWGETGGVNLLYPRQGTRFALVGENNGSFLTRLSELGLLEVTRSTARLLPEGTAPLSATLTSEALEDRGTHLALRLPLGARVAYRTEQTSGGLRLTLYDTLGDPASLNVQPLSDPLLGGLTWSRQGDGPLTAEIALNARQQWGYDAVYEGTDLVLQMRRPPSAPADPALPLAGRTIVVDPGHGGRETGGAGALRNNEKDIVLAIGLEVAALLRVAGANVVLTRQTDVQVPLYTRDVLAETQDADLLVSIHANALPDGTDPRSWRGTGVYFTHPQAEALAGSIQEAILASPVLSRSGQPGDDGLHPDADLALTRPSSQISLLVETAYLTNPGNLRTLMSREGRSAYAEAIVKGILDFYAAALP